jgi:hypothetical protein
MTPRERAERLFDRVMRYDAAGQRDSVQLFAPMVLGAYAMLGPLDTDLRYDYGHVAVVVGDLDVAKAQADSILVKQPTHLLGLLLASRVAAAKGDVAARKRYDQSLVAAERAELQKNLPEYERHRQEIQSAIAAAK